MDRRSFLKLLGVAGTGLVVPELVEPRRKLWQVSRAAPVIGARLPTIITLPAPMPTGMRRPQHLYAGNRMISLPPEAYPGDIVHLQGSGLFVFVNEQWQPINQ